MQPALNNDGCKTLFKDEGIRSATVKRPSVGPGAQPARADSHTRRPETLGVKLRSTTEAIDTETSTGRAMWQMIGVLAELERLTYRTSGSKNSIRIQLPKFTDKIGLPIGSWEMPGIAY